MRVPEVGRSKASMVRLEWGATGVGDGAGGSVDQLMKSLLDHVKGVS